jgi:hypothetical protein
VADTDAVKIAKPEKQTVPGHDVVVAVAEAVEMIKTAGQTACKREDVFVTAEAVETKLQLETAPKTEDIGNIAEAVELPKEEFGTAPKAEGVVTETEDVELTTEVETALKPVVAVAQAHSILETEKVSVPQDDVVSVTEAIKMAKRDVETGPSSEDVVTVAEAVEIKPNVQTTPKSEDVATSTEIVHVTNSEVETALQSEDFVAGTEAHEMRKPELDASTKPGDVVRLQNICKHEMVTPEFDSTSETHVKHQDVTATDLSDEMKSVVRTSAVHHKASVLSSSKPLNMELMLKETAVMGKDQPSGMTGETTPVTDELSSFRHVDRTSAPAAGESDFDNRTGLVFSHDMPNVSASVSLIREGIPGAGSSQHHRSSSTALPPLVVRPVRRPRSASETSSTQPPQPTAPVYSRPHFRRESPLMFTDSRPPRQQSAGPASCGSVDFALLPPSGSVGNRQLIKTRVKKLITRKVRKVRQDGEVVEDIVTEEIPDYRNQAADDHYSDTSSLLSGGGMSDFGGRLSEGFMSPRSPSVTSLTSPPPELSSPGESVSSRSSLRVYTDTVEGEPEVVTDVQEREETLPDGRVIIRKIIRTRQKQTIVKRTVLEDDSTAENNQSLRSSELRTYSDTVELAPAIDSFTTEAEETQPDGTVAKKSITKTSTRQLKTERTMVEGAFPQVVHQALTGHSTAEADSKDGSLRTRRSPSLTKITPTSSRPGSAAARPKFRISMESSTRAEICQPVLCTQHDDESVKSTVDISKSQGSEGTKEVSSDSRPN